MRFDVRSFGLQPSFDSVENFFGSFFDQEFYQRLNVGVDLSIHVVENFLL